MDFVTDVGEIYISLHHLTEINVPTTYIFKKIGNWTFGGFKTHFILCAFYINVHLF